MENFAMPLLGGVLIGLSSSIMLGALGRITGVSGILSSVISQPSRENLWRYMFILGLLVGGWGMLQMRPDFFVYSLDGAPWRVIIAGLIVGFGTRLGSGCTSGHGVCGIPRFSARSIVATVTFMIFGILTVTFLGGLS